MKNFLTQKRQKFHAQIRAQYLENYMKKVRYQVLKTQQTQKVNELIDQTQTNITQQQFEQLIYWANEKDENNAIIHLGNLMIDGVVEGRWVVGKFQLRPKSSIYWPWLMKVIVVMSEENCNQQEYSEKYNTWEYHCLDYSLNLLSTQLPPLSFFQCLTIVKLLLQKYLPSLDPTLLFTTYKPALFSIKHHCMNIQKNISTMCYEIIDMVVEAGDEHTRKLVDLYTLGEMEHLMVLGMGRFEQGQRKFPVVALRTVNNILATGITVSENVIKTCVKVSYNQKNTDKTKLQLSYLWQSFVQNCPSCQLLQHHYNKILHIIENILSSEIKKQNCLLGIKQNFTKIIEILLKKAHEFSDMALMDLSYKANVLLRHYIHGDAITEEVSETQFLDLGKLRKYYRQKGEMSSDNQGGQGNKNQSDLNNSRNTTITEDQMDLEN